MPAPHWIFLHIYRNERVLECTRDVGFRPEPGHRYRIDYRTTGNRCVATAQDLTTNQPESLFIPGACEG